MKVIILILFTSVLISCKSQNHTVTANDKKSQSESVIIDSQSVIVYKTKKNYNNLVPVLLNDDKNEIISYPDQNDLKANGRLLTPLSLQNDYLLDNKGIGKNVAFLNYTYREFFKFEKLPSLKKLDENILDKSPIKELYNCGSKSDYQSIIKELNEYIDNGLLSYKCKRIKM